MNVMTLTRALIVAVILAICVPAIAEVHGVLRVVKGDVQIKSGSSGVTARAKLGQEVYPKDTIITGKDARAKVVMIDNNELNISPDSHIEIQNYEYNPTANKKDVLLNVLYGKVRSKVEQKYDGKTSKFQVKTPSAVAGVRGTDFVTGYNQATKTTTVVTFRGAVEFGLPGAGGTIRNAVSVMPGKMSQIAESGAAPAAPSAMSKDSLAKFDRDTKADGPAKGDGSSSGSSDPRAPAGSDKDKGKGDSGSSSGSSSDSSSGASKGTGTSDKGSASSGSGSSGQNTGGGDTSRSTASTGSGTATAPTPPSPTMINKGDLATAPIGGPTAPIILPPPPPPPPSQIIKPPDCTACLAPPPVPPKPNFTPGGLTVHVNP